MINKEKVIPCRAFLESELSCLDWGSDFKVMSRPSPSPSGSSSSSATPPPQVASKKKTSAKASAKTKKADTGRNEGVNQNWAYTPPSGAVLVKGDDVNGGEFDWDRINNDEDLELWLIRVPESVSNPSLLQNHCLFET